MDTIQTVIRYPTIDKDGFHVGHLVDHAINEYNSGSVVLTELPDTPLQLFRRWRWVDGCWVAEEDYRGHAWYDPADTSKVHQPTVFDDAPPAGWVYWEPGQNRIVSEAESSRIEEENLRVKRNQLLAQSDWTQLPDVPLETKEAWAVYRQALRDITEQEGYPFNIVWPTPPA